MSAKYSRGQGAVEFLMTYGWALLIILVVMVVVWSTGLFSAGESIRPGSYGFWGMTPTDFKMSTDGQLDLSISNGVGANATVNYVLAISTVNNTVDVGLIEPGSNAVVSVSGLPEGSQGSRFEVFVVINYTDSRFEEEYAERLSSGSIWGSFE